MNQIFIPNSHHLGDIILLLNIMHSRCVETQELFQITGPDVIKQLFEIFEYDFFEYLGSSLPNSHPEYPLDLDLSLIFGKHKFIKGVFLWSHKIGRAHV